MCHSITFTGGSWRMVPESSVQSGVPQPQHYDSVGAVDLHARLGSPGRLGEVLRPDAQLASELPDGLRNDEVLPAVHRLKELGDQLICGPGLQGIGHRRLWPWSLWIAFGGQGVQHVFEEAPDALRRLLRGSPNEVLSNY